jgi:hypothetical protein
MLETLINDIKKNKYKLLLVSTTARKSAQFSRLPDKSFNGEIVANILITNQEIGRNFFAEIDGQIETILIDVERKQEIDLIGIVNDVIKHSRILPYKPNDVTLEAADQLILNQLGSDLTGKKILVYGTGNISFKLALRLLEREVNVSIVGRNLDKVLSVVTTLNMIKPGFSNAIAREHHNESKDKYDGIIALVSSEKVVEPSVAEHIKRGGFAIDGGIGNFQGQFIADALEKEISVLRLDVRLGNPFLLAGITALSSENEFFNSVIGSCKMGNMMVVAGGIIGEESSIIVDRIKNPSQIIGVANGYGGLKNEEQLTEHDRKNLQYARKTFV